MLQKTMTEHLVPQLRVLTDWLVPWARILSANLRHSSNIQGYIPLTGFPRSLKVPTYLTEPNIPVDLLMAFSRRIRPLGSNGMLMAVGVNGDSQFPRQGAHRDLKLCLADTGQTSRTCFTVGVDNILGGRSSAVPN
jgi:hypothetical protein